MIKRMAFLAGAAVGYVLGTKAGRERYEQLKQTSRRMTENPTFQETAGLLRAQAEDIAGSTKEKVTHRLQGTRLGERIPGVQGAEQGTEAQRERGAEPAPGDAAGQSADQASASTMP